MSKLPNEIMVYQFDVDESDGTALFAIAQNIDEIPDNLDGKKIGVYTLNRIRRLRIKRELFD